MKTIKMILVGVLLVFTIACSFLPFGFNSSDTPDNAVNESMYENDVYRFLIPEGWELRQPRGEYYDLGVKQELVVESGTKSGASFTIASGPLASGETLETRFALAYREGPQIEEVSTNQFLLGTISGFEIAYQRPWGEPWWQFRDIWMEKDGIVYVLSFQAYPDDFDSQAQTFDSILDSFSFNDGETLAAEMPEAETADFPKPPSTARIAFWAHGYSMPCGSGEEIFVMNIDGSGITNISNSCGDDRDPAWSPDGKWITFTSERDGNAEVYIMNADGSNQTRVTDSPENEHYPQFSPDGKRIVFS